jgi:hypothetical protein
MWQELKSRLIWLLAGFSAMAAVFVGFLLRKRSRPATIKVVPKVVPADENEMLKQARKEGIIK